VGSFDASAVASCGFNWAEFRCRSLCLFVCPSSRRSVAGLVLAPPPLGERAGLRRGIGHRKNLVGHMFKCAVY